MTFGGGVSTTKGVVATFGISTCSGTGVGDIRAWDSKTTRSGDPGTSFGFEGFGLGGLGVFSAADVAAPPPSTIGEGGADML